MRRSVFGPHGVLRRKVHCREEADAGLSVGKGMIREYVASAIQKRVRVIVLFRLGTIATRLISGWPTYLNGRGERLEPTPPSPFC